MIPESRGLRQGRARRCHKSVAAHTQASGRKTRTWKRACKGSGARGTGQGGSSRKAKGGRMQYKYGEMSKVEQPGPRNRSFPKSLRCRVCRELGVLPVACQPSPAPGNLLSTSGASQTSGPEGSGTAPFPQEWGIQAWESCFDANPASSSAGLWNW